jgi:phage-related protein
LGFGLHARVRLALLRAHGFGDFMLVDGLGTVKEWVGGIKTEVGGAWSDVWEFLRGLFDLAWSNVKATVGGGIGSVWEWVQGIGGAVSTAWSGVWEALSAPFLLAWDGIKEVVEPAINGLATAFGAISRAVETLIGLVLIALAFAGMFFVG